MNQTIRIALGITVAAVLLGCGGGEGQGGIFIPFPQQNNPGVRLFNGLDGQQSITALYRDASLNVLGRSNSAAFGGTTNDTVVPNTNITATISSGGVALFTSPLNLVRINSFYTLYTGGNAPANFTSMMLQDSQATIAHRTIQLRAVELSVNSPSVDLYFAPGTTFSPSATLFTNLTYANVSAPINSTQAVEAAGYLSEPFSFNTPTYTVFVTAHGSQTVLASAQLSPVDETCYTIAVYDTLSGPGTSVTILPDFRAL